MAALGGGGASVTFWGAAQTVTGSMHLVEADGRKVLLDCGLSHGPRFGVRLPPVTFPFAPAELDAVVLSHAHVDHCGLLPVLVRQGFAGPICCTAATRDLIALMLADSARIQEEEAHIETVVAGAGTAGPLFSRHEVERTVEQCLPLPYHQDHELAPGIHLRLANAGHILGSAMVRLALDLPDGERTLTFTGDLGRRDAPLVGDADPVPAADFLLSECTYGGRTLDSLAQAAEKLEGIVRNTVEHGGKVLIPAFSLGRTQTVLHYLLEARRAGRIPDVPLIVDSPLAAEISEVYQAYTTSVEATVTTFPGWATRGAAKAEASEARYVRTLEESKEISSSRQPYVVVAPGGMCDGGRIVRHLKENIDDPRCTVVMVSYQAPHSLGRRLLQPGPRVRIHGRVYNRWADFVELSGFSGHADRGELLGLLTPLAGRAEGVRLVHGEPEQAEALASFLRAEGFTDVAIPRRGETLSLASGAC
jgi:metallo-beta-lactamase family protein